MISRNVEANTSCAAGDGRVGGHRVGCSRVWRGERSCGHDAAAGRHGKTSAGDRHRGRPGRDTGTVTFEGTPPAPRPLRTDSDPLCKPEPRRATSEVLLVGPGNALQNVFVYVKDGLGARTYAIPPTTGVARSEGLPVHSACVRRAGRPDIDHEQRHDAPQREREPGRQPRVQLRPADGSARRERDVRQAGGHGPLPLRRPPVDERLRRGRGRTRSSR